MSELDVRDQISEVSINIEKAKFMTVQALDNYGLERAEYSESDARIVGYNAENIKTSLNIVVDYLCEVDKAINKIINTK